MNFFYQKSLLSAHFIAHLTQFDIKIGIFCYKNSLFAKVPTLGFVTFIQFLTVTLLVYAGRSQKKEKQSLFYGHPLAAGFPQGYRVNPDSIAGLIYTVINDKNSRLKYYMLDN